jgi:hypothetical protein
MIQIVRYTPWPLNATGAYEPDHPINDIQRNLMADVGTARLKAMSDEEWNAFIADREAWIRQQPAFMQPGFFRLLESMRKVRNG